MTERFDFTIIGAGIAGASLAAELAPHGRVLVLEGESVAGYHTTGRSAAFWHETIGGPAVYPLTAASGPWLGERGFLGTRGGLHIGRTRDAAERFIADFAGLATRVELIGRARLEALVPGLRAGWDWGAWEPACADIDVAALHQHYLAQCRQAGSVVRLKARVDQITRGGEWHIGWAQGNDRGAAQAAVLVNAAGAWADAVAQMAGAAPLGIVPLRRTMAQLRIAPIPPADLPLTLSLDGDFYFRPQGARLWLSPHDETPDVPRDASAEEIDVARAIAAMELAVNWRVERIEHGWAGLRSFAPDRLPVYGFDPQVPGLFWFAGQGGFGIQTAPAAARLAAHLITGRGAAPVDPRPYRPGRFTAN